MLLLNQKLAERICQEKAAQIQADELLRSAQREANLKRYRADPVAYAEEVLAVALTDQQKQILRALVKFKKVLVLSGHSVGKTFILAVAVCWFFDCYVSRVLTTAPVQASVKDLAWSEIRAIRKHDRDELAPSAPLMWRSDKHYAMGFTAKDGESFQGRHAENMFIGFDECVGIKTQFWVAADSMLTDENNLFLGVCNPTNTSSEAYDRAIQGGYHVISISCLEHPNVLADLVGEHRPFPGAVSLAWVQDKIRRWCEPVEARFVDKARDFEFPLQSGNWYRPGPLFESRVLGRWPSQGMSSVWGETAWNMALIRQEEPEGIMPEIACDVARFGDDDTVIGVRHGPCVTHGENHNGWSTTLTEERLIEIAEEEAEFCEWGAHDIPIKVDDDGVGGGVTDTLRDRGYNVIAITAGTEANDKTGYPNKRSELWFEARDIAMDGLMDLSRLSEEFLSRLRRHCFAPKWKQDGRRRRVVEPKEETKKPKNLGESPDFADMLNLLFYEAAEQTPVGTGERKINVGKIKQREMPWRADAKRKKWLV